jgi:hypothetical protein
MHSHNAITLESLTCNRNTFFFYAKTMGEFPMVYQNFSITREKGNKFRDILTGG